MRTPFWPDSIGASGIMQAKKVAVKNGRIHDAPLKIKLYY
jgi:hypothetical protein